MKVTKLIPILALLATSASGCLTTETIETRVQIQEKGKQATVIIEYANISSDKPGDVRSDFQDLLEDWHGDEYLLDRTKEGFFVKNREVFIRDERIVGRETAIVKDMSELEVPFCVNKGERIMLFDEDKDFTLAETNGKILKTENNTLIVWPEKATELR